MRFPYTSADNRLLLRFLGKRFIVASCLTFSAAILLGLVDYWFALAIQLFLNAMGLLVGFASPLSRVGAGGPLVIGAVLLGLGAFRAAFILLQGFCAGIANEEASTRIRTSAILRILPWDGIDRTSQSEGLFIYSELSSKAALYLANFIRFLAALLQTLILGTAMLYLSWLDCVIAAGLLVVAAIVLLRINVYVGHVAKLVPKIWMESVAALESAGRNWFYIRVKQMHEIERDRLLGLNAEVQAISFRIRGLSEVSPSAVNFLAVLILVVLANVRTYITHTSPLVFLSFLYVFLRFAQSLGSSARSASGLIEYKPYFEQLRTLIRVLSPGDRSAAERVGRDVSVWGVTSQTGTFKNPTPLRVSPQRPNGPNITLRTVSFRYGENTPWILRDFDASVAPGSQLAIVGPSGCGKSTLISLILGFLKPVSGKIDVDGRSPDRFCTENSEYIGYVGSEPYIVTGTVRDNIMFGSRSAYSDAQIWSALSLAALSSVVRGLPLGLDTPIRHQDIALSMGQRQRLAMARAVLPQPLLLILDEASAHLDDATEAEIAASISSLKGTTTIIIASHKLGLVKHADQTIVLAHHAC